MFLSKAFFYIGILFVHIFLLNMASAQNITITGKTLSLDKSSVSNINVVVYKIEKDTLLSSFTSSNANGEFKLALPRNFNYIIFAHSLSFDSDTLSISALDTTLVYKCNLKLYSKVFKLDEVIVKSNVLPIIDKKDTTSYNVKAFADGTERNIEDLIKKLPGMKVESNGKISFRGKAVQKVMIDGEDIFSKNYQLITRNLTINAINKIEAINNYQENPLLADIEKTNKTVLNLSVKKELKLQVFGNASLEAGIPKKVNANLALVSLLRKFKSGLVSAGNNTGNNPITDVGLELISDNQSTNSISSESNELKTLDFSKNESNNDIEIQRFVSNNVKLIGWDLNYQINDSLKIKTTGYFLEDKTLSNTVERNIFLLDSSKVSFRDSLSTSVSPKIFIGQIKLDYKINRTTSFEAISDFKLANNYSYEFNDTQNVEFSEKIKQSNESTTEIIKYQINIVKRLKSKNAFLLTAGYSNISIPEISGINGKRYALYLKKDLSLDSLIQNNHLTQKNLSSTFYWKGSNKLGNFRIGLGISDKLEYINSNIKISDKNNKIVQLDSNFSNQSTLKKNYYFLEGLYDFRGKMWNLSLGGSLNRINFQFHDSIINKKIIESSFLISPNIGFQINISKNQSIGLYYNRLQTIPNIQNLTSGFHVADYRSFNRNVPVFNIINSDMILLLYQNQDWAKLYSFSGSISYNNNSSTLVSNYQITNLLTFSTSLPVNANSRQLNINLQLDKFITPLSTRIQLQTNFNKGNQLAFLNSETIRDSYFQFMENKIIFRSVLKGFFNFEVGSSLAIKKVIIENQSQNATTQIKPYFNLRVTPSKSITAKISAEKVIRIYTDQKSETDFLDMSVFIAPENSKWSFEFSGRNLLNNKEMLFNQIDNYSIYQKVTYLQPRFVLLKIERRF